jgi:hypothetical protein
MATFPAKTSYNNGDYYYNTDVNDFGDLINKLYGNGATTIPLASTVISAKGDLLTGSASGVLSKTAVGTNNQVLFASSGATAGVAWGLITSAMITDGTITGTDIAGTTITASNVTASTLTSTQMDKTTVYCRGTTTLSNASALIHYGTSTPASGTGGIGDIFFQY